MSVATLKRKTQTQYNNMSVGSKKGFSLNGALRSQGYVGQTMLSRSLPRTLMNGITPRGHGGCCGKYPITPIIQSAVTSLNDPTVIKPSVLSSYGRIENYEYKYGILRPKPFSSFKPDVNQNTNDCSTYIYYKRRLNIDNITKLTAKIAISNASNVIKPAIGNFKPIAKITNGCCPTKKITGRYNLINNYPNMVTKSISDIAPISQGERLELIDQKCGILDINCGNYRSKISYLPILGGGGV